MYKPKVYTASKIYHAPMWRSLSTAFPQLEFVSRWIQAPPGPDHDTTHWNPEQKTLHWIEDIQDVQRADYILAYTEKGDSNKGTLVEIGCAIGLGKVVLAVGFELAHSWQAHPLVFSFGTKHLALEYITGRF